MRTSSQPSPEEPRREPGGSSEIRDLLVLADGRAADAATLEYAARTAAAFGAHVTGAFAYPPLPGLGPGAFAVGPAIAGALAAHAAAVARLEQDARTAFERAAAAGVAAEWRTIRDPWSEDVATHARYADLVVLSRSAGAGAPLSAAHSVIFGSGRPALLVPARPPLALAGRVLVGWNASREAARAVADAMPFLTRAAAVELLVLDPDARPERHGAEPGADMARHLARHGVEVDVRVERSGESGVAAALLSRASELGADLLVMGAYGHWRLTEFVFGGATRTVLCEAELPVLMSR